MYKPIHQTRTTNLALVLVSEATSWLVEYSVGGFGVFHSIKNLCMYAICTTVAVVKFFTQLHTIQNTQLELNTEFILN